MFMKDKLSDLEPIEYWIAKYNKLLVPAKMNKCRLNFDETKQTLAKLSRAIDNYLKFDNIEKYNETKTK